MPRRSPSFAIVAIAALATVQFGQESRAATATEADGGITYAGFNTTGAVSEIDRHTTPVYYPPCVFPRADANCDTLVDFFDVGPFVLALTDIIQYQSLYCAGDSCTCDTNCDGAIDFFDIEPFLDCLFATTPCPQCP